MANLRGPLNLGYATFVLNTTDGNTVPIKEESIAITFDKVATGQSKSPYFNILQALLGTNGVNGMGTQENIYIGIHEPGSVFDSVVYPHGAVDMAIWDTSVKANPANGSVVGNWYDYGNNQRLINDKINLVDGVKYTVGMKIVGDAVVGYITDEAGNTTEIGSFSGLASNFQGFKNRIITELEFTSEMDSSQLPLVASTFSDIRFNGSGNVRLAAVYDGDATAGTTAASQTVKMSTDKTFSAAAGAGVHYRDAGSATVSYATKLGSCEVLLQGSGATMVTADGRTDIIANASRLQFSDMSINLKIGDVARTISQSQLNSLIELYIAYINRTPDADGMQYWIGELKNGKTLGQIGESFYAAAVQYSDLTGYSSAMSNDAFVRKVYKNVLGRDSVDAEGLKYWSDALAGGTETRGSLVATVLGSAHTFRGDKEWGWVSDLLDNKIAVGRSVAINNGLVYNDDSQSVSQGMAIAAAITATDITQAIQLVGLSHDVGLFA